MRDDDKTSVQLVTDLIEANKQNAYLIVLSAKSAAAIGKMHQLAGSETVLGRAADAQLQVDDEGISRKHCKVSFTSEGTFQVVDLGSTNGTFVNGQRVDTAKLSDGDKIQIGSTTVLKFCLQDQLEERYQRAIYESATRDGLTRLYNKKFFLDTLEKEFAFCLRHRVPMSLLLMDVDHFKNLNDSHGHQAGDLVLARIALRLSDTVRTEDVLARFGGEEFALLLRDAGEDKALACAERCRRAVNTSEIAFSGQLLQVTISIGVASFLESGAQTPQELIAMADNYLYRAKQAGRNRVDGKMVSGM